MKTPLFIFIVLLLLLSTRWLFSESPFQTKIIISSDYLATTGYGGERRNNIHEGIDCYAVNFYGLIKPIAPGVVTKIGIDDIYGKYVEIKHIDERGEYFSFYAHGKKIFDSAIGEVTTDTPIMIMGSTGYSDSPHLHLEVYRYVDGIKVNDDPKPYVGSEWIKSVLTDDGKSNKTIEEKIEIVEIVKPEYVRRDYRSILE